MKKAAIAIGLVAAFAAAFVLTPPKGARSMRVFDPVRLTHLEVDMWKAYYAKQRVRLFSLLVTMLHEQYHYSWATATREGFHLARAAATFGDLKGNYDVVLPDLETAYAMARDWTHAEFDPARVARAELAWWAQRRVPGANSPEQVGALIADEYALLYETSRARVADAALLRAEAGALRDAQAPQPDWDRIRDLLLRSYTALHAALSSESV